MLKTYNYLLFDLDDTFWSVSVNQRSALGDIYYIFAMDRYFENFETFREQFAAINSKLWLDYRDNKIDRYTLRNDRFNRLLLSVGVDDNAMALNMSDEYLRIVPTHTHLIDGTKEILEYLRSRGYKMSLVTNGFNEVQFRKVELSGIESYFEHIITSEFAGCNKPSRGIFDFALSKIGCERESVLMIGDDPHNDVFGALDSGLDCVFFNEQGKECAHTPTYTITHLSELESIL